MNASKAFGQSNWKNEVDINWDQKDSRKSRFEADDQECGHVKFKMPISHPSEFVIKSLQFKGIYQAGGKNVKHHQLYLKPRDWIKSQREWV